MAAPMRARRLRQAIRECDWESRPLDRNSRQVIQLLLAQDGRGPGRSFGKRVGSPRKEVVRSDPVRMNAI